MSPKWASVKVRVLPCSPLSMSQKKLPKSIPETQPAATFRELAGSSYIVLHDGTVARKLKPRLVGETRYWFLSSKGHLRCFSQKTVDELTTFP